jgi:hypothetical protein
VKQQLTVCALVGLLRLQFHAFCFQVASCVQ